MDHEDSMSSSFGNYCTTQDSGYLFEVSKRQCVSREIMMSYELLNNHHNNNTNTDNNGNKLDAHMFNTGSANKARGSGSQFAGFFDPLHHEGLNDMDLLATLGLKDLSHTFMNDASA